MGFWADFHDCEVFVVGQAAFEGDEHRLRAASVLGVI